MKDDAVPTIFLHRPKPKRRKGPARRSATEPPVQVHAVASDHTYSLEMNFGINTVKSLFIHFQDYNTYHIFVTLTLKMPCHHFRDRERK